MKNDLFDHIRLISQTGEWISLSEVCKDYDDAGEIVVRAGEERVLWCDTRARSVDVEEGGVLWLNGFRLYTEAPLVLDPKRIRNGAPPGAAMARGAAIHSAVERHYREKKP